MQMVSHRGQKSMKLVGTVRGSGTLRTADHAVEVSYQLDTFEERNRQSSSGALEGDLSFAEDKDAARLELESGEEIAVLLIKPDADGADFQTT